MKRIYPMALAAAFGIATASSLIASQNSMMAAKPQSQIHAAAFTWGSMVTADPAPKPDPIPEPKPVPTPTPKPEPKPK